MKRYLRLLRLFTRYSLIHIMIYKGDFIIWSLVDIGWFALSIYFYQLLYANVDAVAGWTKPQVFLLQGIYFLLIAILWGVFWNNFRELPIKINQGTLDFEIIKPIDAQFLISLKHLDIDNFNSFLLGIITIVYAFRLGEFEFHFLNLLLAVIALILGIIFFYSCYLFTMSFAFWFDRIDNLPWLFPSTRELIRLPQPFYQGAMRLLFVYFFPIILITSLPTQLLLGISSHNFLIILSLAAFLSFIISRKFFFFALNHYASASS